MKKKSTSKGLIMVGRLRTSGVTTYLKQGKLVTRSSTSNEKRSNTLPQFIQRQKMRHSVALWKMISFCKTWFTQLPTAYADFMSLANRLPVVYVERIRMDQASFLMPGIPMSDGTLPMVKQELGEVNGVPALLTDLKEDGRIRYSKLFLYTAEQKIEGDLPRVRFSMREIKWRELTIADGRIALVGVEFADEMKGWALVQVIGDRCSPQAIVTHCKLYEQYTTEEALQEAAKSYGGLTEYSFLSPRSTGQLT